MRIQVTIEQMQQTVDSTPFWPGPFLEQESCQSDCKKCKPNEPKYNATSDGPRHSRSPAPECECECECGSKSKSTPGVQAPGSSWCAALGKSVIRDKVLILKLYENLLKKYYNL